MEQQRIQNVLRFQYGFRVFVLILSVLFICKSLDNQVENEFFLGVGVSAFVWALVEIFDLVLKTISQYQTERNAFFIMTEQYWSKLRPFFYVKEKSKVQWDEVIKVIDHFQADITQFPFKGGLFSISKDFEKAFYYVSRLNEKSHQLRKYSKLTVDQTYLDRLYQCYVIEEHDSVTQNKLMDDMNKSRNYQKQLADIEINFQPLKYPDHHIDCKETGDLKETVKLFSLDRERLTFKPALDFHHELLHKEKCCFLILIYQLLFRRIEDPYENNH